MFGRAISGAVLASWREKKAKDERHLVQARFVAPVTEGMVESIDDGAKQAVFRFMLDGVLESARFRVPDGLVSLNLKCKMSGDNGSPVTREVTIKDAKPTRIEPRSPRDDEPESVAITLIFRADDETILHLWHTRGEKSTLKMTPQKVAKQTTIKDQANKKPSPDKKAAADAPPPAA